jgi:hypothetical protein
LQAIQIGNRGMSRGGMQIEVMTDINHPLGHHTAVLGVGVSHVAVVVVLLVRLHRGNDGLDITAVGVALELIVGIDLYTINSIKYCHNSK